MAEHDKSSSWVRDLAQQHFDRVHARIESLATQGGLSDPNWVAQQICLLIDGAIATAMVSRNAQSARVARSILQILLREAKKRPEPSADKTRRYRYRCFVRQFLSLLVIN